MHRLTRFRTSHDGPAISRASRLAAFGFCWLAAFNATVTSTYDAQTQKKKAEEAQALIAAKPQKKAEFADIVAKAVGPTTTVQAKPAVSPAAQKSAPTTLPPRCG